LVVFSRLVDERWAFLRDMQLLGHIQSKNKLPLLLSADSIYRHQGNYSTRDPRLACSSQLTTSSCVLLSSYFLELICLS
ncbi:unnamed protein product, partial [Musa acuminata var. zebrina]